MAQHKQSNLDAVFGALSGSTRRAVLESLSKGSLPVTDLAQPHGMSLTGFMKHLRVLEDAGLVSRSKEGRVVQCTLSPEPMRDAVAWLARYRKFWTERLDSLASYLDQGEEQTKPYEKTKTTDAINRRRIRSGAKRRTGLDGAGLGR
jgi:DNA-binding transcriptional ArsR family regulator